MEKNMKKSIYFIILGLFFVISCNDFLEVEPQAEIPSDAALSNGKNVEATLISSYGNLAGDNFLGKNVRLYSELLSDNIALGEVSFGATDFTGQVAFRNTNILNKDVDNLWSDGYRAISQANAVINAIDNNLIKDNTPDADKVLWKAEALFIRAIAHFELVRLFGKPYSNIPNTDLGVPIRIKDLTADEKIPRATVDQVYNQVISDLTEAEAGLTNSNGNRATKWAAKGYLVRVYFNKMDYEKAFAAAQEIITDDRFPLAGDPHTAFRTNGNVAASESVLFQLVSGGNSFTDFRPEQRRWSVSQGSSSLFEDLTSSGVTDFRYATLLTDGARIFSTKWDTGGINPPIIRMAEIYLIHAESAVSKTAIDLAAAASSYNKVRALAVSGYTPVTFATKEAALSSIQTERRIEMLFEGDRFYELKRLKSPSFGEVKTGANIIREAKPFNDASWLLKIPVSETSGNSGIIQN
jgi:starch-binding outer membrane protein, SusD/RagB family